MKTVFRMSLFWAAILAALLQSGCTPEVTPIEYGLDACVSCRMNIVDPQHASELVTQKGKVFKYDAIECMIRDLKKHEDGSIALYLVNVYGQPKELLDATACTFLISENLPSPMGAYLTAFPDEASAATLKEQKGGKLYDWSSIKAHFDN